MLSRRRTAARCSHRVASPLCLPYTLPPLGLIADRPHAPSKHSEVHPGRLEQNTRDRDHFQVKNSSPPSYTRHVPPHGPTASVTCVSTVSRPICPISRSVCASPRFSPLNPHDRNSDPGNIINEPSFVASYHDRSTPRSAPLSPLISPLRRKHDHGRLCYRSSPCACNVNLRNNDSEPISLAVPPPRVTSRSTLASSPIVIPHGTNYAVDRSYPSIHRAHKSGHEGTTFEPYGAVAPRAPAASSPTARAAAYAIPAHRGRTPDVVAESPAPRAAVRSVSKEI